MHSVASTLGPGTTETLTTMSARAKMSTQSTAGHPPQSRQRRQAMLGGRARSALALSRLGDRCSDRRQLPRVARRQRASQSVTGPVQLAPRSREASQPAPSAAFTKAPGSLVPSEAVGVTRRCAGARATRRSCGRQSPKSAPEVVGLSHTYHSGSNVVPLIRDYNSASKSESCDSETRL